VSPTAGAVWRLPTGTDGEHARKLVRVGAQRGDSSEALFICVANELMRYES